MKTLTKNLVFLLVLIFLLSCNRNISNNDQNTNKPETIYEEVSFHAEETSDMYIDYYWSLSDGRYLEDKSIPTLDWVANMTPNIIFYKIEIPSEYKLYQERLRNNRFTLMLQTEETDKLYILENTFSDGVFNVVFNNNFTNLSLIKNGVNYGQQNRVGEQENPKYPLVGVWGELPYLTEYRLIDPTDCVYYMEINKEIPDWGIRSGTYLLKQIDNNTFETISSFSDGHLRLEKKSDRRMVLTPLFTLPEDEEGIIAPLVMDRSSIRISELNEEDFY